MHRRNLARLFAQCAPRHGVWLSRAWAVSAAAWASLQSAQTVARSVCRKLVGQFRWSDALFGYRVHSNRADLSIDRRDSAPAMPKCVVIDEAFDWSHDKRPNVPWGETGYL
jgi:Type II secretory pathway, pullulanase PulA and related glycosidases